LWKALRRLAASCRLEALIDRRGSGNEAKLTARPEEAVALTVKGAAVRRTNKLFHEFGVNRLFRFLVSIDATNNIDQRLNLAGDQLEGPVFFNRLF
jgi:hypothetical protein